MKRPVIHEGNTPEMYAHYARMRRDPIYRIQEMMADLEAERLPAISPIEPMLTITRQTVIMKNVTLERYNELLRRLNETDNKINAHLDRTKKAKKGTY